MSWNVKNLPKRLRVLLLPPVSGFLLFAVTSCLTPNSPTITSTAPAPASFQVALIQERVFPDTVIGVEDPLLVNPLDRGIHLFAAGGETVCVQLVIPPQSAGPLTLEFEPLKQVRRESPGPRTKLTTLAPDRWRVYQILSVPVRSFDAVAVRQERPDGLVSRDFPDALIELSRDAGGVFSIPRAPEGNTLLLLELAVPEKVPHADFQGRIVLTQQNKPCPRPLVLRTWGFDLPEPSVGVYGVVQTPKIWRAHNLDPLRDPDRLVLPRDDARVRTFAGLVGQYCRLLDDGGVEPWLSGVYPRLIGSDAQTMKIDWTAYRLLLESVLQNSFHSRRYWPVPVDLTFPPTRTLGPYNSSPYQTFLGRYLAEFDRNILKPGLAGKGIVCLAWPEGYRQASDLHGPFISLARQVARTERPYDIVNPFIPIDLGPLGWRDFKPFNRVKQVARGQCPPENVFEPPAEETERVGGPFRGWRPLVSGGSVPEPRRMYPLYTAQALAWTAWRYDSPAVVLTHATDWQGADLASPAGEADLPGAGVALVYPGKWFNHDRPVGSLRLKMIRHGLQDVAYLRVLERAGKKDLATWLARRLVRYAHTDACDGSIWALRNDGVCNADPAWALARVLVGLEMVNSSRVPATQPTSVHPLVLRQKMLLNQFRELTEGVALEVDGVRAKNVLDVATGNERIEWTFHAVARNFTDREGPGTLQFLNLSDPLVPIADKRPVRGLAWSWPVRTELKLQAPAAALGVFGVNYQPLALTWKDGARVVTNCRYTALAAQRMEKAMAIDGDFHDWPDSPAAVAGNFQRVGPDGINEKRLGACPRDAVWQTTVRIGYTSQTLYFAFTCYQPRDSLVTRPSNTVEASAGLAWGEDLVEIFIDPSNSDSFNPLDVYHLVLKANGNLIGLRGSLESRTCDASEPWSHSARAAVKVADDRWQAEIALPLADLGAVDKLGRWWGMDFCRAAVGVSELSTWSGTKGPSGKPVSLGNVFLAR